MVAKEDYMPSTGTVSPTVNYTEFASVVFIDADQLVLRNIDHLAGEPGFTSSYTLTCCNPGFPA